MLIYMRLIWLQPKVCCCRVLAVPPLTGLSLLKQGLSCERHKRCTGKEAGEGEGGGGGGGSGGGVGVV